MSKRPRPESPTIEKKEFTPRETERLSEALGYDHYKKQLQDRFHFLGEYLPDEENEVARKKLASIKENPDLLLNSKNNLPKIRLASYRKSRKQYAKKPLYSVRSARKNAATSLAPLPREMNAEIMSYLDPTFDLKKERGGRKTRKKILKTIL